MLHYNVILHVPVLHLLLSYIFLFGMLVALKQKGSAHITVILMKSVRIIYWSRSLAESFYFWQFFKFHYIVDYKFVI